MSRRKARPPTQGGVEVKDRPSPRLKPSAHMPEAAAVQPDKVSAPIDWVLALVLVGIGLAAFHNSFGGAFILDDKVRIVDNALIRQFWPPWAAMGQTSRPIVQFSLALNHAAGGLNPWGYHAVNLGIHLLAGLLLFGIVRRMLESESLRARYGGASQIGRAHV